MKFVITEEAVRGVLEYLSQRPWREVYQAMEVLQNLPAVKEEVEDKDQ